MLRASFRFQPMTQVADGAVRQLTGTLLCAAVLLLSGCASLVQREAAGQAKAGQQEQALRTLEEGLRKYPEDASLRSQYLSLRDSTLDRWMAEAQRQRTLNRFDEAE